MKLKSLFLFQGNLSWQGEVKRTKGTGFRAVPGKKGPCDSVHVWALQADSELGSPTALLDGDSPSHSTSGETEDRRVLQDQGHTAIKRQGWNESLGSGVLVVSGLFRRDKGKKKRKEREEKERSPDLSCQPVSVVSIFPPRPVSSCQHPARNSQIRHGGLPQAARSHRHHCLSTRQQVSSICPDLAQGWGVAGGQGTPAGRRFSPGLFPKLSTLVPSQKPLILPLSLFLSLILCPSDTVSLPLLSSLSLLFLSSPSLSGNISKSV